MDLDGDALAGVAELFGGLSRPEFVEAVEELAFRRAEPSEGVEAAIDDAVAAYRLVPVGADDETLLVPGPAAFPTLPDGADDLPHILDVERRHVDREAAARAARRRLRADVDRALAADDPARLRELLEVTYDLESWAPVDASDLREEIDEALA